VCCGVVIAMVEVTLSDDVVVSTIEQEVDDMIEDNNNDPGNANDETATAVAEDTDRHRRPSRTTLLTMSCCRTPATSISHAMATDVTSASMTLRSGISVRKVTSRGCIKPRIVTISRDCLAVFCTHQPILQVRGNKRDGNETNSTSVASGVLSTVASRLPIPMFTSKGFMGLTKEYRSNFLRYMDVADIDYVCSGVVTTRNCEQTRSSNSNRLKGKKSEIDLEQHQIVTIGHHGDQTLDVLVTNEKERMDLINCVNQMKDTYQKVSYFVSHETLLLRYIWYDVDVNKDGRISESEFQNILTRINLHVKDPSKPYRAYCKARSLKQGKGLLLPDVVALLQTIKDAEGSGNMIAKIWKQYFGDKDVVDASEFLLRFVYDAQGETTKSLNDVLDLFQMINSMEIDHCDGESDQINVKQNLSRSRFAVYMHHEFNDAYDPISLQQLNPDMKLDQPISQYFINTSHNTYLMGDQLQSSSSVEMYDKALRRGCKCLEFDCWDGDGKPSNGTTTSNLHPVVFHGHTFTSKILFADILQVVKRYLTDYPNTYPIILSLETHCSTPFQAVMAQLLVETFGSKLYIPPMAALGCLPSPEALRGMIVVKGKRPPDEDDVDITPDDSFDPYESAASGDDTSPSTSTKVPVKQQGDPKNTPVKPPKVCKELARLTLFHGTKWKSFEHSLTEPKSHMHSISESKITKIINKANENDQLWRTYNEDHMTRTYPAGSRVDSSNYNPLLAWSMGCQLVALNFQTSDIPLLLNDGFFRQNSNCGYILKPQLLSPPNKPALRIRIRILSGSCLPKPYGAKSGETIDPFVQVLVHDVTTSANGVSSYVSQLHTTNPVNENGFCPVWDEPGKEFTIHHPNIAMIQFVLKEADIAVHDEIGFASIPIGCLRSGYRSVQLYDRNNTRSGSFRFASLLVHIELIPIQ
jgi:phosphatidylinositol phospholipase C, delta